MATKHGKVVTYRGEVPPINSQNPCGHVRSSDKLETCPLPQFQWFVRLVCRVLTYREELPSKNFQDSAMRWSFEVTCQIKYITSPLAEDPWIPN